MSGIIEDRGLSTAALEWRATRKGFVIQIVGIDHQAEFVIKPDDVDTATRLVRDMMEGNVLDVKGRLIIAPALGELPEGIFLFIIMINDTFFVVSADTLLMVARDLAKYFELDT
ncbi:hypothetical protein A3K34_04165 [candidate division WWE3 bacterium RIFOXYC1_FULL_40_10]|uniref:Uncharacterized protein n=1 Tax=candidate division WWE3 bacterium RIFOXYA2_FULL_46_9 TaxID=1802636 RepID=A0A1F4W1M6_UNCKA|nr:MAG: hypothetical protein A3K58_04165 [candidate division WWE3 bacterium RIFOXYB1_FULL_40_22]OGC62036.1 MAG: hypothetical protein A3K37_04165 [candidate division WWE3 bacterium RIFOXYA1_FULL_40_11]OGC62953.1 MAG: hypothetical protein A2264_03680 [candidate division WWE3 bacterium RIFOXYA2_FULL_46_9]OGC65020.1 MAG: hypothetical protein A2326_03205 [candidate division WWE3 bacterium RIFOXYB2_FULL_41_6]OGC66419.1 MAG: hypothetical protein A3K34_04165 [candidate division WWE3 bacterium RIFOXYC1_